MNTICVSEDPSLWIHLVNPVNPGSLIGPRIRGIRGQIKIHRESIAYPRLSAFIRG